MITQNDPKGSEILAPGAMPAVRPSAYELATEILIPLHATTDFQYSWQTHKSVWETRKIEHTYSERFIHIGLPQQGWELVERPLLSRIVAAVSESIEHTHAPSPRLQMEGRMSMVDERLCLLRFLRTRELRQGRDGLPFAGWWEVASLSTRTVAKLITTSKEDEGRYPLGPIEQIDYANCLNFLRVQLPSAHHLYLLPSQLLKEEQKQMDRLALKLAPTTGTG